MKTCLAEDTAIFGWFSWLFEKDLVDAWIRQNTIHSPAGLLGHLVERLLVIQGSDDWLLERALGPLREALPTSLVTATVGSLGGLRALLDGRAHLAGVHVDDADVSLSLGRGLPSYPQEPGRTPGYDLTPLGKLRPLVE